MKPRQQFDYTNQPTLAILNDYYKQKTSPFYTDNEEIFLNWLNNNGKIEDASERNQRYNTFSEISQLIQSYYSQSKVYPSGSTALKTFLRGGDIDIVVILKSDKTICTLTQDFSIWLGKHNIITRIYTTNNITVLSFFYPIESFISHKIDVLFAKEDDLTMASLEDYKVAPTLLVDIHSVRAINGYRLVKYIQSIVTNKKVFRYTLMTVKSWAKAHNCYGNRGKFGGVVWTVMMAKICLMFPQLNSIRLLHMFFNMYSYWPWPKPVVIERIDDGPNVIDTNSGLLYLEENSSPMPVICPVYPYENMTSMVKVSDAVYILKNMREALSLLDRIKCSKQGWEYFFSLI